MKLANYVYDEWIEGDGDGIALTDPVSGEELVRVSSDGVEVARALAFARGNGGPALRALGYEARAAKLGEIAAVLTAHRSDYFDIALKIGKPRCRSRARLRPMRHSTATARSAR